MAGATDAGRPARIALAHSEAGLLERGVGERRRLLDSLCRATEQVFAVPEHGRDQRSYRAYLGELYSRLDADPLLAGIPELPRQRLRWQSLGWRRAGTGVS